MVALANRMFIIDAFTERPFSGNPAAVCLLDDTPVEADAVWMQAVAAEMNLSETAFLRRSPDSEAFALRWFTPVVEVPLCGHATLASAHLLYEEGFLAADSPAQFDTLSGRLIARRTAQGIAMDFPLQPVARVEDADVPEELRRALGVPLVAVAEESARFVVELGDEATLRALQPDLHLVAGLQRSVAVTCASETPGFDFISRVFLPHRGIPEDPVTGGAHCSLADYWRGRLGKEEFVAYQASRRGGVMGVRIEGERVMLSGQAVTVLQGALGAEAMSTQ